MNYPGVGYFELSLQSGMKDRRPELCVLHFSSTHQSRLWFNFSNTETVIANMGQVGDITKIQEQRKMFIMTTKSPDYFLAWWTNQLPIIPTIIQFWSKFPPSVKPTDCRSLDQLCIVYPFNVILPIGNISLTLLIDSIYFIPQ